MRQRGTKLVAGVGTAYGKDFTIYALKEGKVSMTSKKMTHFDGSKKTKKIVNVI
jgi:ribosomal protein L27